MQEVLFGEENKIKIKKKSSTSGKRFQNMVCNLLSDSGWAVLQEYVCGFRLAKKSKHRVDILASKDDKDIIISCKYQDVQGTAPDKLAYEYMCLLHTAETCLYDRAYLITFGKILKKECIFKPENEYTLSKYMRISNKVVVCDFEDFSEMVNRGKLLK